MRKIVTVAAIVSSVALPAFPSAAGATPVRTGTILGGWAPGIAYLGPSPRGCEWTAECAAWLASGCDPSLAGRNPGLHDSIVPVRGLGSPRRVWEFRFTPDGPTAAAPVVFGGLTVQLWTSTCRPLGEVGNVPGSSSGIDAPARFRLPPSAAWMTVASSDNTTLRWTLSPTTKPVTD